MTLTHYLRPIVATFWIASLLVGASSAQAQTPARTATSPEMVLQGCLRSGPNPSGVPAPVTYTLEPVETTPPTAATDTTGPRAGTRYTLTSEAAVEFASRVGQKVEISGHLKDLSKETPGQAKEPPQPGGAHRTFEVASLTVIAAKCP